MSVNEIKVLVLGAGGVGKTCLTIMFVAHQFMEEYDPTIEDSYRSQRCIDDIVCLLDIYDTAGCQEEPTAMRLNYFAEADGHLLVFSLTDRLSFAALSSSLERLSYLPNATSRPTVVVGNKLDLVLDTPSSRAVLSQEGEEYAAEINAASYIETSAKTDTNVDAAFHQLVRSIRSSPTFSSSSSSRKCHLL